MITGDTCARKKKNHFSHLKLTRLQLPSRNIIIEVDQNQHSKNPLRSSNFWRRSVSSGGTAVCSHSWVLRKNTKQNKREYMKRNYWSMKQRGLVGWAACLVWKFYLYLKHAQKFMKDEWYHALCTCIKYLNGVSYFVVLKYVRQAASS